MDYYDLLGVKRSASADELKTAYKKQAMKNHPDKGGDPEKFKQINEAYQALSDPQQKQMYDQFGTTDPQQAQMNSSGFHFTSGAGADFEDVLRHFGFGAHFGRGFANQQRRNKDIKLRLLINLVDIFTGKTDTVTYKLPNGKTEIIDITIPPGIEDGDVVKFSGYGDNSFPQFPRGDLLIQIQIKPDPNFRREGSNIFTSIKVDIFDLIIGCQKEIATPDKKKVSLTIPPTTLPNTVFNISGYGCPSRSTNRNGNLLVEVKPIMPKLDSKQLESLKNFKNKIT